MARLLLLSRYLQSWFFATISGGWIRTSVLPISTALNQFKFILPFALTPFSSYASVAIRATHLTLIYLQENPSQRRAVAYKLGHFLRLVSANVVKVQDNRIRLATIDARMGLQKLQHGLSVSSNGTARKLPGTVLVLAFVRFVMPPGCNRLV